MNFLKEVQRRNNEKLGWDLTLDMGKNTLSETGRKDVSNSDKAQKFRGGVHLVS